MLRIVVSLVKVYIELDKEAIRVLRPGGHKVDEVQIEGVFLVDIEFADVLAGTWQRK